MFFNVTYGVPNIFHNYRLICKFFKTHNSTVEITQRQVIWRHGLQ
jgi:hypothetical protein